MAHGTDPNRPYTERESLTNALFTRLGRLRAPAARHSLIQAIVRTNLPLCDALANRFTGRGPEHDDLVQVARVGLLLAVERFRPAPDTSFVRFAAPTIVGELKRYFRDCCWVVRPPRKLQELRPEVERSRAQLSQELGRFPSDGEVAESLHTQPQVVRDCLATNSGFHPVSLDAPVGGDSSLSLAASFISPEANEITLEERVDLQRAMARLESRQREVIVLRFSDDLTQSEIAARLGVSQMQVSRLLRRALATLRDHLEGGSSTAA